MVVIPTATALPHCRGGGAGGHGGAPPYLTQRPGAHPGVWPGGGSSPPTWMGALGAKVTVCAQGYADLAWGRPTATRPCGWKSWAGNWGL